VEIVGLVCDLKSARGCVFLRTVAWRLRAVRPGSLEKELELRIFTLRRRNAGNVMPPGRGENDGKVMAPERGWGIGKL